MASLLFQSTSLSVSAASRLKCDKLLISVPRINSFSPPRAVVKPESLFLFPSFIHPGRLKITAAGALSDDFIGKVEKDESLWVSEEKRVKFVFWVVLFALVSLGLHALCGDARAAATEVGADNIRDSGFGVKVAKALRASGWPGEAVVFALATLPVIELRGAIPVGYWLQLHPVFLTVLSVLGYVSTILPLSTI